MKFEMSEAQEELIALGQSPVLNRLEISLVEIHRRNKGVTLACKEAQERSKKNKNPRLPGNYHLCGQGAWNCCVSMFKLTHAEKACGAGYIDTIWRAVQAMREKHPEGLVFFVDDARGMRPEDTEKFTAMLGYCTNQLEVNARMILLQGHSMVYVRKGTPIGTDRRGQPILAQTSGKIERHNHSPHIFNKARKYSWCDPASENPEGLVELKNTGDHQGKFNWRELEAPAPVVKAQAERIAS